MVLWQKIKLKIKNIPATGHSVVEKIELFFPEKLHTTQKPEIFNVKV